mgnify:CR=1 FL=1
MINNGVSKKILIIGADYKEKGGIASVIKSHKHIMETFIFVPSYIAGSKMIKIYYLLIAICAIIYKCIFGGIKIVHVHTASNIDFYRNTIFIYIAKLCNKKVLLHIHGGKFEEFYKKNKGFVRITCNKCDLLLAVSTYFVKFITDYSI